MAFDRQFLGFTVCCEASNGTQEERDCIAQSVLNRVKAGRFEPTIAGVCLQRFQYSEWNDDRVNNANLERVANLPDDDPVLADCMKSVACALAGWPDATKGATHYHDKSIAPPSWTAGARCTLETEKFKFYAGVK